MPRPKTPKTTKALASIERDLRRLQADVEKLAQGVREDTAPILTEVHLRLTKSLMEAEAVVSPLVAILRGGRSGSGKAAPSEPTKKAGPWKPATKKRTGRRGVAANLTADQIESALKATGGVKSRAAAKLGVTATTFDKYLKATGAGAATKKTGSGKKSAPAKGGGGRKRRKARAGRKSAKAAGA